jgi:esterase
MRLHAQTTGDGPPLVVLHGLFGDGDNWRTVARQLAGRQRVIALDLRNHGRSPHAEAMNHDALAGDVRETLDELGVSRAAVLGHSLGGKVAMHLALTSPERVGQLLVVDIAPRAYPPWHRKIIHALRKLDLRAAGARGDLDAALAADIPQAALRQFLLKSVDRDPEGGFRWRLNLAAIDHCYETLCGFPEHGGVFGGPVLLLRGAASEYVTEADLRVARKLFPALRAETIPDAGHWVHAEQPGPFVAACAAFLAD